ncbi:hypothetical protein C3941_00910 [Kaistia algarum]|nr:hypothetical protein C3941_00910 [Kaistia algarum]
MAALLPRSQGESPSMEHRAKGKAGALAFCSGRAFFGFHLGTKMIICPPYARAISVSLSWRNDG